MTANVLPFAPRSAIATHNDMLIARIVGATARTRNTDDADPTDPNVPGPGHIGPAFPPTQPAS